MVTRRKIAFLLLALPAVLLGAVQDVWTGVDRIVAIGDVHGDYKQFVTLLQQAGLIDKDEKWTGGKAHLVQTGDVPDRGPDTRKVMDLLIRLEKDAVKAGGYVHALIGNHEAMMIYGDIRYVVPEEFASFAEAGSQKALDVYYANEIEAMKRNPPPGGLPRFDAAYRKEWDALHPLGFAEHREAFGPRGAYGKWIRKHNAIVKINDTVFLHGGIGPKYGTQMIQKLNDRIRNELEDPQNLLRNGVTADSEGPLWYRGLAQGDEAPLNNFVDSLLRNLGAKRIVLGHTVTAGTVTPRFGGRVILNDNGMSAVYGSRLACLVIEKDQVYTLHRGQRIDLPTGSGSDLLEYYRKAAALDPEPSPLAGVIRQLEAKLGASASR